MPEAQEAKTGEPEIDRGTERSDEPETPEEKSSHAVVSIPGSLRAGAPRPSFWQRISLKGARRGLSHPTNDDRLLARLDGIAARVASTDQRIEQLDRRFTEVWEVEEQLSRLAELREVVVDMQERQGRVDGRLRGLERRLSLITIFAGTAAAAALVAAGLALLSR